MGRAEVKAIQRLGRFAAGASKSESDGVQVAEIASKAKSEIDGHRPYTPRETFQISMRKRTSWSNRLSESNKKEQA